jgi:predicted transcriptional regulator
MQPEVSVAINYLIGRKWAEVSEYNPGNKGRPVRQYRLGTPVRQILDALEEEIRGEFSAHLDVINRLRTVIQEPVPNIISN